jgi:trehalose/maltose hydrolase-like predicted phosphorylase
VSDALRPAPRRLTPDPPPPAPATAAGHRLDVESVRKVLAHFPLRAGGDGTWTLSVGVVHDDRARWAESLLTLSDGRIGTRGSLEEDGPSSAPATLAAGVYEPSADTGQVLMSLPTWVSLALPDGMPPGQRVLDLRTGVLWRAVAFDDGTSLRTARWACLAQPGTEVLLAEGTGGVLQAEVGGPRVLRVDRRSPLGGWVAGQIETTAARSAVGEGASGSVVLARTATFESGTASGARSDPSPPRGDGARRLGPLRLFAQQQEAWRRRWRACDAEVVGDPELTLATRFSLFQLAGAVSDAGEAAVGARGLTGSAYAGHVFWDADVFVLPVLAATWPAAGRALLEYRIRRLPAARRAALAKGRAGARFPWESAADGEDVTPRVGVNELGQSVPIVTGELEEHITADVAWAAWHFASVTGGWAFLDGPGRGLLVETARYWASRVRLGGDGRGHIDGVMGPDEYHDRVDDNAFTNVMAAWNLRRAAEVAERTAVDGPIGGALDGVGEAEEWLALADSIVTGYDPRSGRHQQFAGYHSLEQLLASGLGPVPLSADLVLGRERLMASQIVKQADVLMLHHLVPEAMEPGSLQADLDYYLPRTVHGSSLSPAVHASVLARAGRPEEAAGLLDLARRVDLDDLTGTTGGGLHLAAMGGLWQALVFGFAGLRITRPDDPALVLDPHLPAHWGELRIRLTWHGTRLQLRCRNDAIHVVCTAPVSVVIGPGRPVRVEPPGRWVGVGGEGDGR